MAMTNDASDVEAAEQAAEAEAAKAEAAALLGGDPISTEGTAATEDVLAADAAAAAGPVDAPASRMRRHRARVCHISRHSFATRVRLASNDIVT